MTDTSPALDPDPTTANECEMLLGFLRRQRQTVLKAAEGLTDEQARWTPPGRLTPIIAILNHLPYVEWRWVDGRYLGEEVSRSEEIEFEVSPDRSLAEVMADYDRRAARTEEIVRSAPSLDALSAPATPLNRHGQDSTCGGCCCISSKRPLTTQATPMPRGRCSTARACGDR
jgi:hypothetical protein